MNILGLVKTLGLILLANFAIYEAHAERVGAITAFTFINGKVKKKVSAKSKRKINLRFNLAKRLTVAAETNPPKAKKKVRYTLTDGNGRRRTGSRVGSDWLTAGGSYVLHAEILNGVKKRSINSGRIKFSLRDSRRGKGKKKGKKDNNNGQNQKFIPAGDIPMLADWERAMVDLGARHCQNLKNQSLNFDSLLAATYYDAEWVFYQIGDYTGDSKWYDCAQAAETIYNGFYVIPNNGHIPGYWNFTHGLSRDYLSTGDTQARNAAILLSQRAAFADDATPSESTVDHTLSREVAYAIMSYLNAEHLGAAHRPRTELLVNQALGHLDQWFVSRTAEYVRPFMFALTAHALISYDEQIGGNAKILPAIQRGADWLWDNTWLPGSRAFQYTDRSVSSGGTEPAPDLNLLIAPVYAWLWHKTGEVRFRDRADQIFAGGVEAAYVQNPKQFNQNYRWSFDYIRWRSQ